MLSGTELREKDLQGGLAIRDLQASQMQFSTKEKH